MEFLGEQYFQRLQNWTAKQFVWMWLEEKSSSLIMISFHSKFYEGVNYIGSNMIKVSVKGTKKSASFHL